jgi:predicted lipoprotein with Yx(FWY)xxD motif
LLVAWPCIALQADTHPPEAATIEMGAGTLFVDDKGHTLYTYKRDQAEPGTSVCIDECAEQWPPLVATADAAAVGDWSLIEREPTGDWSLEEPAGTTYQWAYKARPVYRYAKDLYPGAIVGEKASGFWDVLFEPIATPADVTIMATVSGQTLIDSEGRTIYANSAERCDRDCMAGWRPVSAPWLAGPIGADFAAATGSDGAKQWVFRGQHLFVQPSQGSDNRRDSPIRLQWEAQGWQPVLLQAPPAVPDWVRFQESDLGPVLANEDRKTLYYVSFGMDEVLRTTCDPECIRENFDLVVAAPGTEAVGNWSPVPLEDGTLQWNYLGRPVYTYKHDRAPGDTRGDKFGSGANIRGGWQAILKDTLVQNLF